MTRTSRWREYPVMRLITVLVVLSFASSSVGISAAAPSVAPSVPTEEQQAPVLEAPAPAADEPASEEGVADESVVAPPVTDDPQPSAEPDPAEEGVGPAPAVPEEAPAPDAEDDPAPEVAAGSVAPPEVSIAALSGVAVAPTVITAGGSVQLSLEGYRTSPSLGWTTGNLGSLYREGDWVPYRMIIDNSNGDAPAVMPVFSFEYDHYASTKNAIGVDKTRNYNVSYVTAEPGVDDASVWVGTSIAPSSLDAPWPSGAYGSSPFLKTSFAEGVVVVPAGKYAVVYFQAHLSMTAYWRTRTPARDGSGYYPGSSMQMRLDSDAGDKTVPIPVPPRPGGAISGVKFNDHDHDGVRDAGDEGLGGWVFHLTGGPEGFPLDITVTSASDGTFQIPVLPAATYSLNEEPQADWQNSTPLPLAVVVHDDETTNVLVGNYHADVTKTFSLSIDWLPPDTSAFVRYLVDGVPRTSQLGTDTPLVVEVTVPYGSVISNVRWYALWGDEELLLATTSGETMTSNKTNSLTYDSGVRGTKFNDADGDGVRDAGEPGLGGWTIILMRGSGQDAVEYARSVTATDGSYTFPDVLPGSYYVEEVQQAGWYNTVAPTGSFAVANGTNATGLNFGNIFVNSSIDITKSGPTAVHVGDSVPYVLVVTNTGNYRLTDVMVTDALLGIATNIGALEPGQSRTITDSVVAAAEPDPLPNTATAVGSTVLGGTVSDFASHMVDIIKPAIDVVKTASVGIAADPASVVYTFRVTNTGEDTLTAVALTDDHLSVVGASIGTLSPGQVVTLTASAVLDDDVTNVAGVSGTDVLSRTVTDTAQATVDVIHPSIAIVKTAGSTIVLPGTSVLYTYAVTNTGDYPLHDVTVVDDVIGPIGTITLLAPQATTYLTMSAPVSTDTVNTGTATGWYGTQGTSLYGSVMARSSASVDVVHPAVTLVKEPSADIVISGSDVTYTFTVRNTGDVTLMDLVVSDDHLGLIGTVPVLALAAQVSLQRTVELTATTTNIAVVNGYDVYEHPVTATDDARVTVVHPAIDLVKSVSAPHILTGGTVVYTFRATNTGDVPLNDVSIVDDHLGAIGSLATPLAAGASFEVTRAAVLTADTVNVATATAIDDYDHDVADTASAMVDVHNPVVTLDKSVEPGVVLSGESVVYTYRITNTGDMDLHHLILTDDILGTIGTLDALAPAASHVVTTAATISTDVTNVGTVEASYGDLLDEEPVLGLRGTLKATDDASVDVVRPAIAVVKTVAPDAILAGESVVYSYTVTNSGDVDLFGVTLTDDRLGDVGAVDTLVVGDSRTFTRTATLGVPTLNTVLAAGTDRFGHEVTDADDAFVDVAAPFTPPDVTIDKSADRTEASAGDSVTYTLTYRNVGAGPAYDITIVDDFDERYVTIVDAGGGAVSGGRITWDVNGVLYPEDAPRTIVYTVRIDSDLPDTVTRVDNTVVISEPTDTNLANNSDTWRVTVPAPFLPFTGGPAGLLGFAMLIMLAGGLALRRLTR